jgi:hypothetical protein
MTAIFIYFRQKYIAIKLSIYRATSDLKMEAVSSSQTQHTEKVLHGATNRKTIITAKP